MHATLTHTYIGQYTCIHTGSHTQNIHIYGYIHTCHTHTCILQTHITDTNIYTHTYTYHTHIHTCIYTLEKSFNTCKELRTVPRL